MPIRMMYTGRGARPVIVCDQCGKRIEEGDHANAIWNDSRFEHGAISEVMFVHSLNCDQAFQRQHGMVANSMELDLWLVDAINNLNINWTISQKRHQEVFDFGNEEEEEG